MSGSFMFRFYTILWILYSINGTVVDLGFFSPILLAVLLAVSLYYCYVANKFYQLPMYLRALNWLLVLFSLYGVASLIQRDGVSLWITEGLYFREIYPHAYILNIYSSLLPIYVYYVLAKQKKITISSLHKWVAVFLIVITLRYFQHAVNFAETKNLEVDEITNNVGYVFLSLVPLLFLLKGKQLFQLISIIYILVFVILSFKRGAIIILFASLPYFFWRMYRTVHRRYKTLFKLIVIFFVIGTILFSINTYQSSEYFQKRIEQTQNNEQNTRELMYAFLSHKYFYDTHGWNLFFGYGADATVDMAGNFAHNDWLEILINQGLIGILFYLAYWIAFYKHIMRTTNNESKAVLVSVFIIYILRSFFSMSYADMNFMVAIAMGLALTNSNVENRTFVK